MNDPREAAAWLDDLAKRVLPVMLGSIAGDSAPLPRPGDEFGPYRLVSEIGRGGLGVVFLAHDVRLRRSVALKFLIPRGGDRGGSVNRLLGEARLAASLDHPGIAVIHDVGETAHGLGYIVMAHCKGETLRARLERGALPVEESLSIARQITDALVAAHDADVIHRDIKPSNVILSPGNRVKVVDFGIATGPDEAPARGPRAGTLPYMAPERLVAGRAMVSSDIWSVGVLLYEMVAGRRPFEADEAKPLAERIREGAATPLSQVVPDAPRALSELVNACLAPSPPNRPTARLLYENLLAISPDWPARLSASIDPGGQRAKATELHRAGRHHLEAGQFEDAGRARDAFLAALDADPLHAPAWSGLSDAYEELGYRGMLAPEEAHPRARAAAERALEIDPDLAEAHVSLGTVLFDYYRDRKSAEAHYERALALDPCYAKGRQLYAEFLRDLERFDEAIDQIDEAIRLDPLSPYHRLVRGIILHMARRDDEALAIYDRLLKATPEFRIVHLYRAMALLGAGRNEDVLAALDLADPEGKIADTYALRAVALAKLDRSGEASEQLDGLRDLGPGHPLPYHEAIVRMSLGDHDRAVALLEQDLNRRTWFSRMIAVAPVLDPVRGHPGYQELARRAARPN